MEGEAAGAAMRAHVRPEAEAHSELPAAEIEFYVPLARPASGGHAAGAAAVHADAAAGHTLLAAAAVRPHAAPAARPSNQ